MNIRAVRASGRSVAIVSLAFTIMLANNGCIIAGLTTFDSAMLGDLQLSVAALKLRDTITILSLGLSVPFVGMLLDRVSIRPIIVSGLLTMAAGFFLYRFVQTSRDLYVAHVFLGVSQGLCGLIAHVVLVSRWTQRHRGLALGLVVAGSSLGNALIPSFNGWLLEQFGWRDAIVLGGLVALALVPLVLIVYRERPRTSEVALAPVPRIEPADDADIAENQTSRNFWMLGATAGTSVFCVLGLAFNLTLFAVTDLGRSPAFAQRLLFLLFFASTVAQIAAGLAADRLGPRTVHRAAILFMTCGMAAVVALPSGLLSIAVIVFGAGWGANSAMLQLQPVALFARSILGRTLGLLAVMETFGGAIAPALVGFGRDLTGSYGISFIGLCVVMAGALICVWLIRGAAPRTVQQAEAVPSARSKLRAGDRKQPQ